MKKADKKIIDKAFLYSNHAIYKENQYFIVPNMSEFIRDVTEYGNVGALKKRVMSLSVFQILKLLWINKFNAIKIAKKDFAIGVLLLIEIEILKIRNLKPRYVILSDQLTDLAVVLNNKAIINGFAKVVNKEFSIQYGYMTNNLPFLINKLADWKVKPGLIVTQINRFGYEMNPDKLTVEKYLKILQKNLIVAFVTHLDNKDEMYLKRFSINKILLNK